MPQRELRRGGPSCTRASSSSLGTACCHHHPPHFVINIRPLSSSAHAASVPPSHHPSSRSFCVNNPAAYQTGQVIYFVHRFVQFFGMFMHCVQLYVMSTCTPIFFPCPPTFCVLTSQQHGVWAWCASRIQVVMQLLIASLDRWKLNLPRAPTVRQGSFTRYV